MIACINVDLDCLNLYRKIHCLPLRNDDDVIYKSGVLRFLKIFRDLNIMATFFVVGDNVKEKNIEVSLKEIVDEKHEVGNHSWSHPYNLIKLTEKQIREELLKAHNLFEEYGIKVVGFRAPGYNINKRVLNILYELNYLYDSSILPSPPYYFARTIIIHTMGIFGKKTSSISGNISNFFSSGNPRRIKGTKILEIPISTFSPVKIPFIGTTIACVGARILNKILSSIKKKSFINLEFHAIDLLSFDDGIEWDLKVEPVLRIPLQKRIEIFSFVLNEIKKTHRILTLKDFALQTTCPKYTL